MNYWNQRHEKISRSQKLEFFFKVLTRRKKLWIFCGKWKNPCKLKMLKNCENFVGNLEFIQSWNLSLKTFYWFRQLLHQPNFSNFLQNHHEFSFSFSVFPQPPLPQTSSTLTPAPSVAHISRLFMMLLHVKPSIIWKKTFEGNKKNKSKSFSIFTCTQSAEAAEKKGWKKLLIPVEEAKEKQFFFRIANLFWFASYTHRFLPVIICLACARHHHAD